MKKLVSDKTKGSSAITALKKNTTMSGECA